jgi:tRNA(fMet)-specific endonuclease VapC
MKTYLIDTNIAIKALKRREPILYENIGRAIDLGHKISLSIISKYELQVGILRNRDPESALHRQSNFLMLVDKVWDFVEPDAVIAAEIRAGLMQRGLMIGALDTLIAAQALHRGLTMVTNNVKEFSRIPDLEIVDWTKA